MTLIIGLLCKEGIVVGSDGAATLGALGQQTVRQPTKKLSIIDNKIIVGTSGFVGLGQRHNRAIQQLWSDRGIVDAEPIDAMNKIRDVIVQHTKSELEMANLTSGLIGPGVARQSALCHTLVAVPLKGRACLFQFDQQCAAEMATENLPFVAIGSGQPIADPFLAFLREIFWKDRQPNIHDGIFVVLWTLTHAIRTAPSGISDPAQVAVITQHKKDWRAHILSRNDLQEHYEFIAQAEEHLRSLRKPLDEEVTPDVPRPEGSNK